MEKESPLSFDRATYAPGAVAGPRCSGCQGAIVDRYWRSQQRLVCGQCQASIVAALDEARAKASFGKAALVGGAVALGLGIAYAIFVQVADMQLALLTIGIAYVIARTVRKASGGLGGRRFQILAVVLTYVASAMGYAGPVLQAVGKKPPEEAAAAAPGQPGAAPGAVDTKAATPPPAQDDSHVGAGAMLLGLVFLFGIILATPVLAAFEAPIGLLIIAIGLYEAWKLSRPVAVVLDGPYAVTSGDAPST